MLQRLVCLQVVVCVMETDGLQYRLAIVAQLAPWDVHVTTRTKAAYRGDSGSGGGDGAATKATTEGERGDGSTATNKFRFRPFSGDRTC